MNNSFNQNQNMNNNGIRSMDQIQHPNLNLMNNFNQNQKNDNSNNFNQNQNLNNNIDETWKNKYNVIRSSKEKIPEKIPETQMYNCVFKTTEGFNFNIPFSATRTCEDLIETFFKRVDKVELFTEGVIAFL